MQEILITDNVVSVKFPDNSILQAPVNFIIDACVKAMKVEGSYTAPRLLTVSERDVYEPESVEEKAYTTNLTYVEKPKDNQVEERYWRDLYLNLKDQKRFSLEDMEECFAQSRDWNVESGEIDGKPYSRIEFKHRNFKEYITIKDEKQPQHKAG